MTNETTDTRRCPTAHERRAGQADRAPEGQPAEERAQGQEKREEGQGRQRAATRFEESRDPRTHAAERRRHAGRTDGRHRLAEAQRQGLHQRHGRQEDGPGC